jgi:IclR family pca regulon transcriptional regulator
VVTDGKLFTLTPRILDLGFAYLSSMPIWNRAEPVMEALVQQVQESCSAAVLDATDIVYVLRVPTQKIMRISLGVGSRLPAYCTSLGRLLLADLDDDDVRARLEASNREALTKHTVTDIDALMAKVAQARAAVVPGEPGAGRRPDLRGRAHRRPPGPHGGRAQHQRPGQRTSAKVMQETMLPALVDAARQVSRLL